MNKCISNAVVFTFLLSVGAVASGDEGAGFLPVCPAASDVLKQSEKTAEGRLARYEQWDITGTELLAHNLPGKFEGGHINTHINADGEVVCYYYGSRWTWSGSWGGWSASHFVNLKRKLSPMEKIWAAADPVLGKANPGRLQIVNDPAVLQQACDAVVAISTLGAFVATQVALAKRFRAFGDFYRGLVEPACVVLGAIGGLTLGAALYELRYH